MFSAVKKLFSGAKEVATLRKKDDEQVSEIQHVVGPSSQPIPYNFRRVELDLSPELIHKFAVLRQAQASGSGSGSAECCVELVMPQDQQQKPSRCSARRKSKPPVLPPIPEDLGEFDVDFEGGDSNGNRG